MRFTVDPQRPRMPRKLREAPARYERAVMESLDRSLTSGQPEPVLLPGEYLDDRDDFLELIRSDPDEADSGEGE